MPTTGRGAPRGSRSEREGASGSPPTIGGSGGSRSEREGASGSPLRTPERDYSGTPLPKKLGIREGSRVVLVGAPEGFTLAPLPGGVEILRAARGRLDVVVLFTTRLADLERRFPRFAGSIEPDGRLWVAWPKKASGPPTDLTFDLVQRTGLDAGLVDNKSASITEAFQGLQFVVRVRDRASR
jgi:hypothetical protein